MRNCALAMIGVILSSTLANENISKKEQKLREELLEHVEARLLDTNSFVRSKAIQVLKMLLEKEALASIELYNVAQLICRRLQDKASNVRKNAMAFLAQFININQFACLIPLPVLKESFETECKKLKEMQ
ncbi:Condensin complex subunit 1, partial [Stegodyphus mimosarum]